MLISAVKLGFRACGNDLFPFVMKFAGNRKILFCVFPDLVNLISSIHEHFKPGIFGKYMVIFIV